MAVYASNKAVPTIPFVVTKTLPTGNTPLIAVAQVTAALAAGDTILGPTVPAGFAVTNVVLDVDHLDSGAALMLEVGDSTVPARYITASNVGQTGGIVRMDAAGSMGTTYLADTQLLVTVTTAAVGAGTGTGVRLYVEYTPDP